ncbi:MAG: hypothetical protein H0T17_09685 [Propionibacteriales bacterium]|nr:hypothetical protein [Propionibacteriales bacterium]
MRPTCYTRTVVRHDHGVVDDIGTRRQQRQEDVVTDVAKKGITFLVLAFAVFYLLTQPEAAANAIKGAGQAVIDGFEQLVRFLSALAS